jgi:hypothetical protein
MTNSRRRFLADTVTLFGAALTSSLLPQLVWADKSELTDLTAVDAVTAMRNGDIKAEDYALNAAKPS